MSGIRKAVSTFLKRGRHEGAAAGAHREIIQHGGARGGGSSGEGLVHVCGSGEAAGKTAWWLTGCMTLANNGNRIMHCLGEREGLLS